MLCDICKKNEATIHIKEVHDGKISASNLCADCAAEKEKKGELGALGFNLAEVLFNLGKIAEKSISSTTPPTAEKGPEKTCPACGWTLEKLRHAGGRLGCPTCYQTFEPLIA